METLRAVLASPQLSNDVVFLFTDGEEAGLLGAAEFVASHPLASHIDFVINIEAIGNSGPATMFETGPDNGWFVREFGRACEQPVASSLGKFVYDLMPNDTDYSCFRERGVPGLNFAICCGSTVYHQATDLPEHLSLNSLAHQGSMALSLVRLFGALDCRDRVEPDAIFFNLPGGPLLAWPSSSALPLTLLLCGLLIIQIVSAYRKARWTLGEIGLTSLKALYSCLLICAAVIAAWQVFDLILGEFRASFEGEARADNTLSGTLTYLALIIATWSGWAIVLRGYSSRSFELAIFLSRAAFAVVALWFAWRAPAASPNYS
ncbi:MAG: hypothetical protein ACI8TQ_000551 [Planctomycetota bacterium]